MTRALVGRSFADVTDALDSLNAGLTEGGKTDAKEKEFAKECAERLAKRRALDAKQEAAKAAQQALTEELEKQNHDDKCQVQPKSIPLLQLKSIPPCH